MSKSRNPLLTKFVQFWGFFPKKWKKLHIGDNFKVAIWQLGIGKNFENIFMYYILILLKSYFHDFSSLYLV